MAAFEFEALDATGRAQRGVLSADNAPLARRELRRRQLVPVRVAPAEVNAHEGRRSRAGKARDWQPRLPARGIPAGRRALLTRQLATLIDAATPVEQALNTIAHQADHGPSRRILLAVRARIMEGGRFAEALGHFPGSFSPVYRAMVATGEASGRLGPVLERLADQLERGAALGRKVQGALIYPAVLALTAFGIVAALMAFVVPRLVAQFDTLGRDLPMLTRVVIATSEAVRDFGPWVLLALLAGLIGSPFALRRAGVRRGIDALLLRLPLLGRLVVHLAAARTVRTLAILAGSGAPLVDALGAASATATNIVIGERLEDVTSSVREGSALSAALDRADLFPPLVTFMAASGEQSGRLTEMLEKAADYLEAQFNATVDTLLALLEPAIILVMGGIVASIVLAILLPIVNLNTLALP